MSGLNERSRRQIALFAGEDLEGEEAGEIRQLVAECPHCQRHWVRIRGCLDILERSGSSLDQAREASLWPGIESRLRSTVSQSRPRAFNGWVPALSMAAACIAMLVAGQMDATWQHEGNWPAPSDRLASGMEPSGWMPITERSVVPSRFVSFSQQSPRTQFGRNDLVAGHDSATMTIPGERFDTPSFDVRFEPRPWR